MLYEATEARYRLPGAGRSDAAGILARLAKGEATVNELAKPFDMSQPSISRHLKVLEEAGLIEVGARTAQFSRGG